MKHNLPIIITVVFYLSIFVLFNSFSAKTLYAQTICSWKVECGLAGPGTCDGSIPGITNGGKYCADRESNCFQCGSGQPYTYFGCVNYCPTCSPSYDQCTGCNQRSYYDTCGKNYRIDFIDSSCSSLCPAPVPDCNTSPDCSSCNFNDLYRCVNNGSQTCTYTTHTSGVSCNQVSYTQTCSTYLCPSDYTCNASTGACQLDLSCTPQSSDTQCGGTCNAATYSSNHTIQVTPSICSDGSIRYSCRDLGAIEGQCGNTTTPPSLCFPP